MHVMHVRQSTRRRLALAALGLGAVAAGCGEDPVQPPSRIFLSNRTTSAVEEMYLRSCNTTEWGEDLLAGTERIQAQTDTTFDYAPGCYDLRVRILSNPERVPVVEDVVVDPNGTTTVVIR